MNFSEIKTEVFRRLRESSSDPAFWTETDVEGAINEGYEEISDASEWYERNFNMPQLSKRTYYDLKRVFGDNPVLTVKHMYNATTRRWLYPVEVRDLDYRTFTQWEDIAGEPEMWFVRGLFWLGTFPKATADSGVLKVYYTSLPTAMSHSYDVPGFPSDFHYGLVEYALGELLSQESEQTKALDHFSEYLGYEKGLKDWTDGRVSLDRIGKLNG